MYSKGLSLRLFDSFSYLFLLQDCSAPTVCIRRASNGRRRQRRRKCLSFLPPPFSSFSRLFLATCTLIHSRNLHPNPTAPSPSLNEPVNVAAVSVRESLIRRSACGGGGGGDGGALCFLCLLCRKHKSCDEVCALNLETAPFKPLPQFL